MNKKLIIINAFPPTTRFCNKLDTYHLNKNGLIVEYWDISFLFFDNTCIQSFFSSSNQQFVGPNHREIYTKQSLIDSISQNKNSIIWYMSRFEKYLNDDWIIDLFNIHNVSYLFQHLDARDYRVSILRILKYKYLKYKIIFNARNCRPTAIITSGDLGVHESHLYYKKSRVINVPSVNIKWANYKNNLNFKYVVYVDESIVSDSDSSLLLLGTNYFCSDPNLFYKNIKHAFEVVEDLLGCPVIIAASGKYIYNDPEEYFGNRTIIYENSFDLIHNATLVLGHASSALYQAIVSKVPVLIIDDITFLKPQHKNMLYTSYLFNQKPISTKNINHNYISDILKIDYNLYEKFQLHLFKSVSVSKRYDQIMLSELINL
jgi:hypothetical protein